MYLPITDKIALAACAILAAAALVWGMTSPAAAGLAACAGCGL